MLSMWIRWLPHNLGAQPAYLPIIKGKGGIVFPMPPSRCPLSSCFLAAVTCVRCWRFHQIIIFQQTVPLWLQSNLLVAQSSALLIAAIEMSRRWQGKRKQGGRLWGQSAGKIHTADLTARAIGTNTQLVLHRLT